MEKVFNVRHKQPKDTPFQRSVENLPACTYQNVPYLTCIVLCLCMGPLYYGLCLSMISAVNSSVLKHSFGDWAGEQTTIGLLIGFYPIGGAIGAPFGRLVLKFFTKKQALFGISIAGIIITGLLQIPNIGLLLALRILQGFAVGLYMGITPIFINEIVPIDLHGSQGVLSQILIVVGVVIDYIFKSAFTNNVGLEFHWRFIFAFSGLPCIIQLIALSVNFIPESPISLIERGRIEEAKEILGRFNVPSVLNDVLAEMIRQCKQGELKQVAKMHSITHADLKQQQIAASPNALEKQKSIESSHNMINQNTSGVDPNKAQRILTDILQVYEKDNNIQPEVKKILSLHHMKVEPLPPVSRKPSKKALFLGFELHFMQQFSGMKVVISEVNLLFKGRNATLSLHSSLIANCFQLAATCFAGVILTKFGRKRPTVIGNLVLSITNFIIAILFVIEYKNRDNMGLVNAAFAFIVFFEVVYALSIGPVVWPYVPELMPHKYVPAASSMNWLAAAICTIATPYILNAVGSPFPVFFFFGGVLLIFFTINSKLLIETKGKTPSQIAAELDE